MSTVVGRSELITRIAMSLWCDFVEAKGADFRQSVVFDSTSPGEAFSTLKEFFRFCASLYADDNDSKDVESHVINDTMPYTKRGGNHEAASWLLSIRSQGRNCPCVIVNNRLLQTALSFEGAIRTKHHLLLHEIGHLVLHWRVLRQQVGSDGSAVAESARPIHEAEAWWFCYAILSLVVSNLAFENKQNPLFADDQIWKLRLR